MVEKRVNITLRGRDLASRALRGVRGTLRSLKGAVFSVQGALVALGAAGLLRLTGSFVRAFTQQQDAVEGLRASLIATGKDGGESLDFLTKRAAELQRVTRFGDEAIIDATASLAQLAPALDTAALGRSQEAIIGIADTFTKGDLSAAALLIGKTIGSTTNALTRYGIQLDVSASANEKLNQILAQSQRFFDVSQAKATTFAGKLQRLTNAWGDLKEAVGRFIAESPLVNKVVEQSRQIVVSITGALKEGGPRLSDTLALLGDAAGNAFAEGVLRSVKLIPEAIARMWSELPAPVRFLLGFDFKGSAPGTGAANFLQGAIDTAAENRRAALEGIVALGGQPSGTRPPGAPPGQPLDFRTVQPVLPSNIDVQLSRQLQVRIQDIIADAISPETLVITAEQLQDLGREFTNTSNALQPLIDLQQFAAEVVAETRTPQEIFNGQMQELRRAVDAGALSQDDYRRAVEKATEAYKDAEEQQKRAGEAARLAAANAILAWSSAAAQMIRAGRGGGFFDIVGSIGGIASLIPIPGAGIVGAGLIGASQIGSALTDPIGRDGRPIPVSVRDVSSQAARDISDATARDPDITVQIIDPLTGDIRDAVTEAKRRERRNANTPRPLPSGFSS